MPALTPLAVSPINHPLGLSLEFDESESDGFSLSCCKVISYVYIFTNVNVLSV